MSWWIMCLGTTSHDAEPSSIVAWKLFTEALHNMVVLPISQETYDLQQLHRGVSTFRLQYTLLHERSK
jgi:hypothetical protein